MSNCDGVSPIVVRAGSVHPEGVTFFPHEGPSQPPEHRAPTRELATFFDVLLLWLPASEATSRRAVDRFRTS